MRNEKDANYSFEIPHLEKSIFAHWEIDRDCVTQTNNTINLLNSLRNNDLHAEAYTIDTRNTDQVTAFRGLATYFIDSSEFMEDYEEEEIPKDQYSQIFWKETKRLIRHAVITVAFGQLQLEKFYMLCHAAMQSLNSDNAYAAATNLRSAFEVVGSYAFATKRYNVEKKNTSLEEIQTTPKIEAIQKILKHRESFLENNIAPTISDSKSSINEYISNLGSENNKLINPKMGTKIYDYLCAFVHPNHLSNSSLLKFFNEQYDALDFRNLEEVDFFSIGSENTSKNQYEILLDTFTLLFDAFFSTLRLDYQMTNVELVAAYLYAQTIVPDLGANENLKDALKKMNPVLRELLDESDFDTNFSKAGKIRGAALRLTDLDIINHTNYLWDKRMDDFSQILDCAIDHKRTDLADRYATYTRLKHNLDNTHPNNASIG